MARNPDIENICKAWWELDHCAPGERAEKETALNALLDVQVGKSGDEVTRDQILDFVFPQYKEYRKARRQAESVQVAQSALKK